MRLSSSIIFTFFSYFIVSVCSSFFMFSLCVTFRNLIAFYINTLFSSFVLGFVNLRKKLTEKRYLLIKIYRIETKEQKIRSILNKHLIYVTKEKDTKCDTFSMQWWQQPYLCSNINTTTHTHTTLNILHNTHTHKHSQGSFVWRVHAFHFSLLFPFI